MHIGCAPNRCTTTLLPDIALVRSEEWEKA
jgi:hypothetical protein